MEQLNKKIRKLENELAEYRRINKELKESEEKLFSIFNSVRDGIVVIDKTGKVTFINKSLVEIGGYSEEEIIGKRLTALKMFTPKAIAKIMTVFAKRMAGKEVPPYEVEVKLKDGTTKLVEIHGSLLKIKNKTVGDVAILRDVTDRKQMEEELKNSEERLKVIFEHAPDAYFLYNLKGNLIDGNKAAEELIGYKKEELIGKNIMRSGLLSLDQIPKVVRLLAEHVLGKATGPNEFVLIRKDRTRVSTEIMATLVKVKGKNLVLGIARDITERKKTEEELKKKNEELERFNKLAVGREIKMIELKKKIKELQEKLNRRN